MILRKIIHRVPDDWLEETATRTQMRRNRRSDAPQTLLVNNSGQINSDGMEYQWIPTPFRFCLACGVSYRVRKGASDFAQLSTLASGGRSSATTILGPFCGAIPEEGRNAAVSCKEAFEFYR